MGVTMQPNTIIKLDFLGRFYSACACSKNPAAFSLSVALKENVDPARLQSAVDKLMAHLPFINVRIKRGFYNYYHVVTKNCPTVMSIDDFPYPCTNFLTSKKDDGRPLRILYKDNKITFEVLHCICDGKGLSRIMSDLLTLYFDVPFAPMEPDIDDAYKKHKDKSKANSLIEKKSYSITGTDIQGGRVISKQFSLSDMKQKTKSLGMTISEYIMTTIFDCIKDNSPPDRTLPLTAMLPVDCRPFFDSDARRNFVTYKYMCMPENQNCPSIKEQFGKIDKKYVQGNVNAKLKYNRLLKPFPLAIKRMILSLVEKAGESFFTTTFSSLGHIQLHDDVSSNVEYLEFVLCPEHKTAHQFACVTVNDTLSLTCTTTIEETEIVQDLFDRLAQ